MLCWYLLWWQSAAVCSLWSVFCGLWSEMTADTRGQGANDAMADVDSLVGADALLMNHCGERWAGERARVSSHSTHRVVQGSLRPMVEQTLRCRAHATRRQPSSRVGDQQAEAAQRRAQVSSAAARRSSSEQRAAVDVQAQSAWRAAHHVEKG